MANRFPSHYLFLLPFLMVLNLALGPKPFPSASAFPQPCVDICELYHRDTRPGVDCPSSVPDCGGCSEDYVERRELGGKTECVRENTDFDEGSYEYEEEYQDDEPAEAVAEVDEATNPPKRADPNDPPPTIKKGGITQVYLIWLISGGVLLILASVTVTVVTKKNCSNRAPRTDTNGDTKKRDVLELTEELQPMERTTEDTPHAGQVVDLHPETTVLLHPGPEDSIELHDLQQPGQS